jgi:hypothetical protein
MKKLTRNDAQAQARRLQSSPMLAPQSAEGRTEIVECILRHCADVEHAARAMTHVLDNCTDPRNLTAEIRSAAETTANTPQTLPPGCEACRLEPDPMTGAERWMAHIPGERNGYSCAVRCTCERGDWLLRRDEEKRAIDPGVRQPRRPVLSQDLMRIAAGDAE